MLNIRRWICVPTLLSLSTTIPLLGHAQDQKPGIRVIDPDKKVPVAHTAALDTEHFEFGLSVGLLAVEDFNSNLSFAASLRYYFSEKYLLEGTLGRSSTRRSSSEETDNLDFVDDRNFQYIAASAGYQFLKGRSFFGKRRKYNSGLYVLGGVEQVDFADESNTGVVIALSYKVVITDWLTSNLDFKNHIVERSFLGDDKITQNTEILFGFNWIF